MEEIRVGFRDLSKEVFGVGNEDRIEVLGNMYKFWEVYSWGGFNWFLEGRDLMKVFVYMKVIDF